MTGRIATLLLALAIAVGCSKEKPIDRDPPSKSETRSRRSDDDLPPRASSGNRLEIVEVDDTASLSIPDGAAPPDAITLEQENPPSQRDAVTYLMTECAEGEMELTCAERLRAFASTLRLPAGGRLAIQVSRFHNGARARTWILKGDPILTEADVADASVHELEDTYRRIVVDVGLYAAGRDRFGEFTADHVRSRIAILTSGRVRSVPVVQSRIDGGRVQITMGSGDLDGQRRDADRLVEQLRGR